MIIKKLSRETIAKIAAGEVVERPANVVKELIENAIDAQAKNLKIFVTNGGVKEITVIDDGIGMSREDLEECFKRHTTSKITSLADLEEINSFGFRGEALSSIAAVSRLYISSREKDSLEGYYVELEGNEVISSGMLGMPIGTKVQVTDLFYNVPARKKYLKNTTEELRAISLVVTRMCLIHPEISFKFYHNESELLNVAQDSHSDARLKNVFSEEYFVELVPVEGNYSAYKLRGYVSSPQNFRSSKNKQHLFVNKRQVHDNSISDAVKSAYGAMGDPNKYPQYILFLDVPQNSVDVNIHPQKERVKFLEKEGIYNFIRDSVTAALEKKDLTHEKSGYKKLRESLDNVPYSLGASAAKPSSRAILQVHNLYLIKEVAGGILVIDQHAAHERILYEKMVASLEEKLDDYAIEALEIPEEINLDQEDLLLLEDAKAVLEKLGITYELSDGKCKILTRPFFMEGRNLQGIMREFLDEISQSGKVSDLDSNTKRAISHLACRLAIKDGHHLEDHERQILVEELERAETPYICPHGRPAKVFIPTEEIGNWFKR